MTFRIAVLLALLLAPFGNGFAAEPPDAKSKGKRRQAEVAPGDDKLPTPEEVAKMPAVVPEKAAELIKEVKVPAEFEATIFATPPAVNYPVFVTAAPDGTLFVSSDGNGSLDRAPHRGRILRVRDTNGDGKADEVKVFVADVDSPRGLVWDHDRLYLLHPPHISVFIDRDGDGVADEQKTLVKNIAFGFKDRPADHSSNGLELGIDGWIYAAIGDFGFMEAVGTDGRRLQLRGGGVVRVRPDGTGLQLFARGTRNILEAATSPLLDLFARDNTNDGGGWDIRLHHFTGLTDHGYPRLYKSFADELIKPLADYGGGSGCGAAWVDEPGIPAKWNNAPLTADWGRGWIYHHRPTPKGATFTADQSEFIGVTRPTDLDVDAAGRIYVASWKGATFKWAGNDVGYIARVTPKGYVPQPAVNFSTLKNEELVRLLESTSSVTRLAAQRALVRQLSPFAPLGERAGVRGDSTTISSALGRFAADISKSLPSRIAALFTLKLAFGEKSHPALTKLASDSTIAAWAVRALTDHEGQLASVPAAPLLAALKSSDARTRKEAVVAIARWHGITGIWANGATPTPESIRSQDLARHAEAIVPLLTDSDEVIAHTAMQTLRMLKTADACFAVVDTYGASPAERAAALRVLFAIYEPKVVDGLLARLTKETDFSRRQGLLTALSRLHFIDGTWTGNSWGTRPDTRGPLYQPDPWSETPRISTVLNDVMARAEVKEAAFLAGEFNRHRIDSEGALAKLLSLVARDASVLPVVVGQLARASTVPPAALPLLNQAASADDSAADVRANAIQALSRADLNAEAIHSLLVALPKVRQSKGENYLAEQSTEAFLNSTKVEKEHVTLLAEAAKTTGEASLWADTALLRIYDRTKDRQKQRQAIGDDFDKGWGDPKRRAQLIEASILANKKVLGEKILAALHDPDKSVAVAARRAVERLKLEASSASGPVVGAMKVEDIITAVMNTRGDVKKGEQLFTQQGCVACHTTRADEPLKGPYLGNIATTYQRRELAESILVPNKTLAQGFVTTRFVMKDDIEYDGFITQEAADKVTFRIVTAQEITVALKDILRREKLEKSLMPEGLVAPLTVSEFASLVDYLEALAKSGL